MHDVHTASPSTRCAQLGDLALFHVSSDVPGPPASAKCVEVFATSIKMSWEAPLKDGGASISNYTLDKRETNRANWAQVSAKIKGDVLELNVEKLIEGREYQFRIRAENTWGVGDALITKPVVAKNPFSKFITSIFSGYCITTSMMLKNIRNLNGGVIYSCPRPLRGPSDHQCEQRSYDSELEGACR